MKCPHCGGDLHDGRSDESGNSGVSSGEKPGSGSNYRRGPTITISVDLASGRYEGPATIVDPEMLVVEFPWRGNPKWRCLITKADIRDVK